MKPHRHHVVKSLNLAADPPPSRTVHQASLNFVDRCVPIASIPLGNLTITNAANFAAHLDLYNGVLTEISELQIWNN